MADLASVLDDLRAEGDDTDRMVAHLDADGWASPTPADGWTIAHQVAHLHWTDSASLLTTRAAAGDDDARAEFDAGIEVAFRDPVDFVANAAEELASTPPAELLTRWRAGREDLADALLSVPAGVKIAWFGPPMSALSMATARLMETWAHGQDIADALGIRRLPTARLKNVAHLGVRTRDFAYSVRSETPPTEEFRIDLTAPNGDTWTWGPDDAEQRVHGSAEHFCLLVTQRAHRDDLDIVAVGADATHWLAIAQAFAGAPGSGRDAGARA